MDHPSRDESNLAVCVNCHKNVSTLGISFKIATLKNTHRDSLCNIIYNIKKLEAALK